jgi:hypothetical protein
MLSLAERFQIKDPLAIQREATEALDRDVLRTGR